MTDAWMTPWCLRTDYGLSAERHGSTCAYAVGPRCGRRGDWHVSYRRTGEPCGNFCTRHAARLVREEGNAQAHPLPGGAAGRLSAWRVEHPTGSTIGLTVGPLLLLVLVTLALATL